MTKNLLCMPNGFCLPMISHLSHCGLEDPLPPIKITSKEQFDASLSMLTGWEIRSECRSGASVLNGLEIFTHTRQKLRQKARFLSFGKV